MKIKNVAAICKKSKRFQLYDDTDPDDSLYLQWLGDGNSFYPLQGLPVLEEDNLFAMLDITGEQKAKMYFTRAPLPVGYNFKDTDPTENILDKTSISIAANGRILIPLSTQQGIVFIDTAYLSPFNDIPHMIELYERVTPDGEIYIAVKAGFLLVGIILPYQLVNEKLVNDLAELLRQCRIVLNKQQEDDNSDERQLSFGARRYKNEQPK